MRANDKLGYSLSWRDRLPKPLRSIAYFPLWQLALVVIAGVILTDQVLAPNARVLKLAAGLTLLVIAVRTPPFYSLCFLTIAWLFPFTLFLGSSTTILILLIAIIYFTRLSLRQVPPLDMTFLGIPIGLLIAAYVVSFYNLDSVVAVQGALRNTFGAFTAFFLCLMTANFIRTEQQLKTFVKVLVLMTALTIGVTLFEMAFPGRALVPHWILTRNAQFDEFTGLRVGGPLDDYELLAEFMVLCFLLCFFFFRRADTKRQRTLGLFLAGGCIFILAATVTRGAIVALVAGSAYLFWCIRRRVKPLDVVLIVLTVTAGFFVIEFIVSNFTHSGSVLERFVGTKVEGGVPDTRGHWPKALARALEHPLIGHGPYFDLGQTRGFTGKGLNTFIWPHSIYLFYLHMFGFFGLLAFFNIVIRAFWVSMKHKAATFGEGSFAEAFMLILHIMLVVFLVDQIKIEYLRNPTYMFFPWILLGLIAATHRIILKQRREKHSQG